MSKKTQDLQDFDECPNCGSEKVEVLDLTSYICRVCWAEWSRVPGCDIVTVPGFSDV